MSLKNLIIGRLAVYLSAHHFNQESKTIRADIQKMIDEAWENSDPVVKSRQRELFPDGKPSPDQFIAAMAAEVERQRNL